jgi:RNA polymerase sigma-70 factor, ECF subfamily
MELAMTAERRDRTGEDGAPASAARGVLTFDEVYRQHHRFVWRVLRAFGLPPAIVEDVVQDVFVVVHRRLPDFEGRSGVRTWLFSIARWVVTHERRRFRAKPVHEPIDEAISDVGPGPFEKTVQTQALRTIERVLSRMDEEKRMVFVLMNIEEMTAIEVAEALSVNVNTVYSRLRLAREQFRRLLNEGDSPGERNEP